MCADELNSAVTSITTLSGGVQSPSVAPGGGAVLPMFPVPERLIVYSTDPFPSTQHAAHILRFSPDHMFNQQWAKIQLPTHVVNAAFLVDLQALERQIDVHVDAYGTVHDVSLMTYLVLIVMRSFDRLVGHSG